MPPAHVVCADSAHILPTLTDHTFDALCTDPPAGIGFMGKNWDKDKGGRDKWIAWLAGILRECRRVMKPGAYGWVWALPRTAHWTATACEDAGFAVRDVMTHVFGTGFPKSRALLKPAAEMWILIKAPGELRELRIEENRIVGSVNPASGRWPANFALSHSDECELVGTRKVKGDNRPPQDGMRNGGFAGVGADKGDGKPCGPLYGDSEVEEWRCTDGCPVKMLDEQSGESKSTGGTQGGTIGKSGILGDFAPKIRANAGGFGDSGGASRFFYTAKPSTKERSAGLPEGTRNTHTTVKSIALMRHLLRLIAAPGAVILDPFAGSGSTGVACVEEGMGFLGFEQEAEYAQIARARIQAARPPAL